MNINRQELLAALEAVKGAVAAKPFQPILTHVLVDGKGVLAFDGEIGIKATLNEDTLVKFNVRFDTFYNLLRALDGEDLAVEVTPARVTVQCGKHKSFLTQIAEDFPRPSARMENEWTDAPSGFKEALARALVSASTKEADKVLSAVLVRGARMYGTDRRTVARCTLEGMDAPPMLISRTSAEQLIRLGQPIRFTVAGPWAMFDYGNIMLLARLREGLADFPPVDDLMARLAPVAGPPIQDGMLAVLTRLALFGSPARVDIRPGAMGLELVASYELGEATEYLDSQEGVSPKGFDPEPLIAALPYADTLSWGGAGRPIYMKGETSGFEFLLSPMVG